jgi:hypothetical protein
MAGRLSSSRAGRPFSPGRFLLFISIRGWVEPRAIVRLEGLGQLKNPMTSSEIEPATFRLVAYCLNQLRYHVSTSGRHDFFLPDPFPFNYHPTVPTVFPSYWQQSKRAHENIADRTTRKWTWRWTILLTNEPCNTPLIKNWTAQGTTAAMASWLIVTLTFGSTALLIHGWFAQHTLDYNFLYT